VSKFWPQYLFACGAIITDSGYQDTLSIIGRLPIPKAGRCLALDQVLALLAPDSHAPSVDRRSRNGLRRTNYTAPYLHAGLRAVDALAVDH